MTDPNTQTTIEIKTDTINSILLKDQFCLTNLLKELVGRVETLPESTLLCMGKERAAVKSELERRDKARKSERVWIAFESLTDVIADNGLEEDVNVGIALQLLYESVMELVKE